MVPNGNSQDGLVERTQQTMKNKIKAMIIVETFSEAINGILFEYMH